MANRIVSVQLAASSYPRHALGSKDYVCLVHAGEVDQDNNPVRVLCGKVKVESVLPDASIFDLDPVTCETCKKRWDRLKRKAQQIAEADDRGGRYLADANEAQDRGDRVKAEKLYAKGQFWLDRSNKLRGNH